MGSSNSSMDPPKPSVESEYDLIEASQIIRRANETAVFIMQKKRPNGGVAYGTPTYAAPLETRVKVRIAGWGYGSLTHSIKGLPVDTDCATALWQSPDLQDNTTYFIVSLVWPNTHSIWVRADATAVRPLKTRSLVTAVDPPEGASLDKPAYDAHFRLPLDTIVTLADDSTCELSAMPAAEQATINFTYSSCVLPGKR